MVALQHSAGRQVHVFRKRQVLQSGFFDTLERLPEKVRRRLDGCWAGTFYREVSCRIDQSPFAVCPTLTSPRAPTRPSTVLARGDNHLTLVFFPPADLCLAFPCYLLMTQQAKGILPAAIQRDGPAYPERASFGPCRPLDAGCESLAAFLACRSWSSSAPSCRPNVFAVVTLSLRQQYLQSRHICEAIRDNVSAPPPGVGDGAKWAKIIRPAVMP